MTEQDIRDWLDANLVDKCSEFGLHGWDIAWGFGDKARGDDGRFQPCMSVLATPQYMHAMIDIDPRACIELYRTLDKFIESVEHELCHVVHSPFELTWDIVREMIGGKKMDVFHKSWQHSQELTVGNMERMAHGLRQTLRDKHQSQFDEVCKERDDLRARLEAYEVTKAAEVPIHVPYSQLETALPTINGQFKPTAVAA